MEPLPEPHSDELASLDFLREWDPSLAGAVDQLYSMLLTRGKEVREIAQSFNLSELQARATKVMDKECKRPHLLAIGGYNAVYLLPFADQTDILARIRIPGGGIMDNGSGVTAKDLSGRFLSEVATLRFLKARTSIPVPGLYDWDPDGANPVGAPYMLLQRLSGLLFGPIKRHITSAGRRQLVSQVAGYEVELYDNPLSSIGCLIDEHGTVGPLCPTCTGGLLPNDRGPFKSTKQYLLACAAFELEAADEWTAKHSTKGGVEGQYAHRWFQLLYGAIMSLPEELTTPPPVFRLVHTDFNPGNLLVSSAEDPTIVAVLDWEGARVLPAWDARAGCNISWLVDLEEEGLEKKHLRQLYVDITTEDERSIGQSPLCLQGLMDLLESRPSLTANKQQLDTLFLDWFAQAERDSSPSSLEAFLPLKAFIENCSSEVNRSSVQ